MSGSGGPSILGYTALLILIVTWVGQSEYAQWGEDHTSSGGSFRRPYLITWVNHAACVLLIPLGYAWNALCRRQRRGGHTESNGVPLLEGPAARQSAAPSGPASASYFRILVPSFGLAVLLSLGDWTWYIGLAIPHTSVATATCVFNSTCVWVMLFSVCFLGERITLGRASAVVLALAGVCVLAFAPVPKGQHSGGGSTSSTATHQESNDASGPLDHLLGSAFVLGAAVCYALYEVMSEVTFRRLKRLRGWSGETETGATVDVAQVVAGAVGLMNVVALWPPFLVLGAVPDHGVGTWVREPFQWPTSSEATFLAINAALALVFNIAFMLAIALTSPLTTSVASMLTIPLSAVCDALLHGIPWTWQRILGSLLVVAGFALLSIADLRRQREQQKLLDGGSDQDRQHESTLAAEEGGIGL